jgi:hypothetical protein
LDKETSSLTNPGEHHDYFCNFLYALDATSTSSLMATVNALWEALNVSLEMARIVNQRGYMTQSQVNEVRAMAERL